jgi:Domain of unknown function (DUF4386)
VLNFVVTRRTIASITGKEDQMDKAMWDRLAAAGGIVGVALFVVAALLYGNPPTVSDDSATVTQFFADNRDRVLWTVFFQGLGVLAILWFVAALVTRMRDAGEARLGAAAFGSFLLVFAVGSTAALTRASLAYSIADEGADLVLPLYHLTVVFDVLGGLLIAGLWAAVAGASLRAGILPRWWGWVSAVAAAWAVINATAWGRDGFWSPTGGASYIGFIVFAGWILVTSILLTMRTKPAEEVVAQPTAG